MVNNRLQADGTFEQLRLLSISFVPAAH